MPRVVSHFGDELVDVIADGGVAIIRTDTLYGIVAAADNHAAVERVYQLKQRTPTKSPIILIADSAQLYDVPPPAATTTLAQSWPGVYSFILPSSAAPAWITRGNGSVAYRLPADQGLQALIRQTGRLIAPSANPEGLPPAMSIDQAVSYFGHLVDLYVDGNTVTDPTPSQLYEFDGDTFIRRR